MNRPGYDALWHWFGLSRASWLTLPRVLMHKMPDDWQGRMAALLNEWDERYGDTVAGEMLNGISVSMKRGNRFVRVPEVLNNYRHPDGTLEGVITKSPQSGEDSLTGKEY